MSQKLKEQSLSPEVQAASIGGPAAESLSVAELDERIRRALHAAAEKKALEPTVLDLRGIASFTDFFLIVTGAPMQVLACVPPASAWTGASSARSPIICKRARSRS